MIKISLQPVPLEKSLAKLFVQKLSPQAFATGEELLWRKAVKIMLYTSVSTFDSTRKQTTEVTKIWTSFGHTMWKILP